MKWIAGTPDHEDWCWVTDGISYWLAQYVDGNWCDLSDGEEWNFEVTHYCPIPRPEWPLP